MPNARTILALLATTALAVPLPRALAQDAAPGPRPVVPSRTTAEDILVTATKRRALGGGLIKQQVEAKSISTVSQAYIGTQPSIQNAYQYLALTPGALVQMADPFGLSVQFSINVHGLGQDELGYVLEGMPLNDIGYYTAYPSQFIDSENIDEVSLAQGSADLDSPVISEAGGLMKITMLDPSVHPGGSMDVSYGSYNTNREFIRLDSGLIGDTGVRAFLSYSNTDSDQWRGNGRVKRQHVDFKVVKEWGDGNRIAWSGEWHDGITPSYDKPTLASYQAEGPNGVDNNYAPNFTQGSYNYWKDYVSTFRILYTAIPTRLVLTDNLTANITPYFQYGYGNSPYEDVFYSTQLNQGGDPTPYQTNLANFNPNGTSVMANFEDLQYRAGVIAKLTYTTGANSIILGSWYDYSDESDKQTYSMLSASGSPADIWADTDAQKIRITAGPYAGQLLQSNSDDVITQTNEVFAADVLKLLGGRLNIEAGFKFAMISRNGVNQVPSAPGFYQRDVNINDAEPLPRLAVKYQIDPTSMVYVSASTDFRTPSEQTFFNQYYQGSLYFLANGQQKTEYSISENLGYRYQSPWLTGSVSVFNYNFTNRQIATEGGANGNTDEMQSINAGGQTTRGIDIEAGTRPWHHISPYVSGEYLHSTIDNDFAVDGDYLPTKGKTAIRSPKVQAALGLTYDDGTFFGTFDVKYVDSQYTTFINDEGIPAYTTTDLGIGYRLPNVGLAARPELKLNFINLGSDYLSGVATPTTNARTAIGRNGTVIPGAAPTYYLSAGLAILFTAKQAF